MRFIAVVGTLNLTTRTLQVGNSWRALHSLLWILSDMTPRMWVASCYSCVPSDDEVQRCIKYLVDKFGDSPRVEVLSGIRIEATEKPETALEYYNKLLEGDPTNSVSIARAAQHPSALTGNNRQHGDERPIP